MAASSYAPAASTVAGVERTPLVRQRLQVRGIVQGVGFRPFVHTLAHEMGLFGWVQNGVSGVLIEIQGALSQLDIFVKRLMDEAPRLARIDEVLRWPIDVDAAAQTFEVIKSSHEGTLATMIGPDSAICDQCLYEMLTPTDRRYRYPFINCTHCGPRYTLVRGLPYDRAQTSMAPFVQCPACEQEYTDTHHRRFHAEPNACPVCGPRLQLLDVNGAAIDGDPIAETLRRIMRGELVAIKGLGGFHLVCDARNVEAVQALRLRKARDAKPFALMALNAASARQWCEVSDQEAQLLESIERPIVLLPHKATAAGELAPGLAPGMHTFGVMLPYTPLHYLLFHEAAGRPKGNDWLRQAQSMALVMTSANPGGEPLVIGNAEARQRLAEIADAWLLHDRDIVTRCDDSVVRLLPEKDSVCDEQQGDENTSVAMQASAQSLAPQFIRRARGYTPRAIRLACAADAPPVLAVGGFFKSTVCVTRGDEAFLSPHIGSLDNAATCRAFDEAIEHLLQLLAVTPVAVAHDRHPDFYSSRAAAQWAQRLGARRIEVPHHQAHIAAVQAEHRLQMPVLGLAFDGVGLGDDGSAWGGELLYVDGVACTRVGHLQPLYLAGGDRAAREPWRLAASILAQRGHGESIAQHFTAYPAAPAVQMLLQRAVAHDQGQAVARGSPHAPLTSSMGRCFDAAAGALKVCEQMQFEGQAAMLLESLAQRYLRQHGRLPIAEGAWRIDAQDRLDLLPLLQQLFEIDDQAYGAALFHGTLIAAITAWAMAVAERVQVKHIVGSGGCWMNTLLAQGVAEGLQARGYRVWQAQTAPANDGGLSLGQAWVALQKIGGIGDGRSAG